ncbi:Alpha/Beta hydrolase protein [Lasiosphaeria miniovina]|uniref:Alpha/Beta hydrolase protein n=1 Tax=Lasiosphaeria miniovina TaxID=1954250 RepID=A0AA40E7H9_9PEZI|nr:Alpha/Beta hydrolase protein [Lasiosphaeria miniovina]KAK0727927.1 Alpha/Beta hydrolase protein [Lasiosphaeria miniovina]
MVDAVDASAGDEVKPYTIHVRTKHLNFTKQKLELTRFPHEGSEPKSTDWWEPKPQLEPLLDFWLERYSWRDQETALNKSLPQFRTSIALPSHETPLRVHFIHVRSSHAHAVPLLLIPPFPLTNLSLGHLVKPLTEPQDAARDQPFHVVIPSLSGLGFSDALPNNTAPVPTTADMLDTLMRRLEYPHYLATNSGPAYLSPAEIDWRLARHLATYYSSSCLGTHLISPPLTPPSLRYAPWEWAKWNIASFFRRPLFGYTKDDFAALSPGRQSTSSSSGDSSNIADSGLNQINLKDPNTLAYALCDSPVGMLSFVLKGLQTQAGPSGAFTEEQIITLTNLAWLPGPENAMRFWAYCAMHAEEQRVAEKTVGKPRVAITVFTSSEEGKGEELVATVTPAGDTEKAAGEGTTTQAATTSKAPAPAPIPVASAAEAITPAATTIPEPVPSSAELEKKEDFGPAPAKQNAQSRRGYAPPAWANAHYDVVHIQRAHGHYYHHSSGGGGSSSGLLLAFERPDVIFTGVRGLAQAVLARDARLRPPVAGAAGTADTHSEGGQPPVAPLEQVVVVGDSSDPPAPAGGPPAAAPTAAAAPTTIATAPVIPTATATPTPQVVVTRTATLTKKRPEPNRGSSGWSWRTSYHDPSAATTPGAAAVRGKGKEVDIAVERKGSKGKEREHEAAAVEQQRPQLQPQKTGTDKEQQGNSSSTLLQPPQIKTRDSLVDGESPDTLVGSSPSPPPLQSKEEKLSSSPLPLGLERKDA